MMNLFARILSHGFAITVVLLLAIGFMYRGELFPEGELPEFMVLDSSTEPAGSDTAGTISRDDATGAVTETTDWMSEAATEPDAEPAASPTEDAGASPGSTVETAPETVAEAADDKPADVADAVADAGDAVVETDVAETGQGDAVAADSKPMADTPADQETVTETVTAVETEEPAPAEQLEEEQAPAVQLEEERVPAVQPEAEQVPVDSVQADMQEEKPEVAMQEPSESVQDDSAEVSGAGPYELLAAAREAYWLRDYERAEDQYQKLIELQPGNPDGYGELGNMYFSQGNWEAAASAYYEAGTRLLNEGLIVQARQMVDVIRGLNGARADELAQQVDAARAASH